MESLTKAVNFAGVITLICLTLASAQFKNVADPLMDIDPNTVIVSRQNLPGIFSHNLRDTFGFGR